jgi:hypothetical protein
MAAAHRPVLLLLPPAPAPTSKTIPENQAKHRRRRSLQPRLLLATS